MSETRRGTMQNERDVEFTPGSGFGDVGGVGADNPASGGRPRTDSSQIGGSDPLRSTGDRVEDVTAKVKEAADDIRHRATEQAETRIEDQKYRAASSLGGMARSLREASDHMPGDDGLGRYMSRAAEQVDNLASFLNNRDVTELVDEVEVFARRQPAAFVGSAFAIGLLGARFLKSSRRNLDSEQRDVHRGSPGLQQDVRNLTSRVPDPTRDAVARPDAPGYAPPAKRGDTGLWAPGER
jgi:hypothetical protein